MFDKTNIHTQVAKSNATKNKKLMVSINAMTKYTMLVGMAIVSSLLMAIAWILLIDVQTTIAFTVDIIINSVCLYLQFIFANNHYYRICKCCNNQCAACVFDRITCEQLKKLGESDAIIISVASTG